VRFVIFGAGAIGGIVGARLHQSGQDAILIARGAHHDAIARDGLRLKTPVEDVTLRVPVAPTAAAAQLTEGDVVLLCVKSQNTLEALESIRNALPSGAAAGDATPGAGAAGDGAPDPLHLWSPPIICLQNAVENERVALRLFPQVYGAVVLMPAEHLEPGVVVGYGSRFVGRIDLGRYPHGVDDTARQICAALTAARIESDPRENIMQHKYAKLINNLVNAIEAICGQVDRVANGELLDRAQNEGRRVLRAAGIDFDVEDVRELQKRWERIGVGEVDGHSHRGGSTWQSIRRGSGSVETDYLNGEITLLAHGLGLAAPVNELLQNLTARTLQERREPGWITVHQLLDATADDRTS
jgi:2-dehydropantoate 2-reductase